MSKKDLGINPARSRGIPPTDIFRPHRDRSEFQPLYEVIQSAFPDYNAALLWSHNNIKSLLEERKYEEALVVLQEYLSKAKKR